MIALYYKMLLSEIVDKKRLIGLAILCYISLC